MAIRPGRRRFLRIGLRTFLVACTVLGLGLAYGARYGHSVYYAVRSILQLERRGFRVQSDFYDRYGLYASERKSSLKSTFEWGLSQPQEIMALNPPRDSLRDSLQMIAGLQGVKVLRLNNTELQWEDLRLLVPLRELDQLDLFGTNILDADLATLTELPALRKLNLSNTGISDEGLSVLAQMKSLKYLTVYNTAVSPAGLAHVRRIRPDLSINGTLVDTAVQSAADSLTG